MQFASGVEARRLASRGRRCRCEDRIPDRDVGGDYLARRARDDWAIGDLEALVRGLQSQEPQAGWVDDDPIERPHRTVYLP